MGTVRRVIFVVALLSLVVTAGAAISMDLYYTLEDPSPGGSFGARVAGAGDLNGDGYGDVMSADPGHQIKEGNSVSVVGTLVVFSGKDGTVLEEHLGDKGTVHTRISVFARAGDVNDDDVPDLVVGAPDNYLYSPIGTGVAWVLSGKDWSVLHTWYGEGEDDHLGAAVAAAGDVDDDGYDDVIVGAPENDGRTGRGRAYVYSGKDGSELYSYEGTQSEAEFGYAVGGGVDLNDDGYDDFFVGEPRWEAPGNTYQAGRVRAYSGKDGTHLWDSAPKTFGWRLGWSVDAVPDVNGDGYDDVVAGAPYGRSNDKNTGIAYILSGEDGTVIRTLEPDTNGLNSVFGSSVACIGDVNGDGVADFVVGAPEDGLSPTPNAGAVYVISGKDATILETWRGTVSYQRLGLDVAGVEDLNADGRPDIACVSSNTRDVYVYATEAPKGTIAINSDATHVNTRSVTLSLTWSDPSGGTIDDMRLRNEGDAWGVWITPAATKAWTLPSGDGDQTVEVQFRNDDGDESSIFQATIYLDETVPVGTILIDAGADYTATPIVPLALGGTDLQSGVEVMRLKNDDGEWEDWRTPSGSLSRELTAGDGLKTVTVQYRDLAGNLSVPAADTISLDETAPVGTLSINGGATFTSQSRVTLTFDLTETGSGIAEVRFSEGTDLEAGEWRNWETFASTRSWTVEFGDGVKVIEAEVRDAVGNTSEVLSARITLDQTPPECTAFSINGSAPYIAPTESIGFGLLFEDNLGGAGVDGFRVSFDQGRTWSDWIPAVEGFQAVTIPRPAVSGSLRARVVVRDAVGNESDPSERPLYIIESNLPATGGKGKVKGVISSELDVDTIAIHLVKDDLLAVKLAAKAWVKGDELLLALDLIAPDGTRLFEGRYPADAKKVSVKDFVAPETGRYLLVVRQDSVHSTDLGTYVLTTAVKAAKTNRKGKGEVVGDVVSFDAVDGAKLKATLKGEGLTAAGVALHGPDGEVVFEAKEGKGKVTLKSVVLTAGTGTYRLTVPAGTAATFKWSVKPPPKLKAENSD